MRGNEPENNSQYEKGGADVNAFLPPMFFFSALWLAGTLWNGIGCGAGSSDMTTLKQWGYFGQIKNTLI